MRVREPSGNQIDFAHAAMPGAEQQAPAPLVQAFARSGTTAHRFHNTKSPDVPGAADIAMESRNVSGARGRFGEIMGTNPESHDDRPQSSARFRTAVPHQPVS